MGARFCERIVFPSPHPRPRLVARTVRSKPEVPGKSVHVAFAEHVALVAWGAIDSECRVAMKPLQHARNSAKRWGGKAEDYQAVHDFFDSTKSALPDVRHRAILHSAFGIFLLERVFGTHITNSAGRQVCVRDLGEDHVIEDLGFIPTIERWLKNTPMEDWMGGIRKQNRSKVIPFDKID